MKKLFLSMLAAVTLFASCSQEEIVSQTGGESLVSFTVTTPELGSRAAEEATTPAIGTGATATDLYFVVYDETMGEQVQLSLVRILSMLVLKISRLLFSCLF